MPGGVDGDVGGCCRISEGGARCAAATGSRIVINGHRVIVVAYHLGISDLRMRQSWIPWDRMTLTFGGSLLSRSESESGSRHPCSRHLFLLVIFLELSLMVVVLLAVHRSD